MHPHTQPHMQAWNPTIKGIPWATCHRGYTLGHLSSRVYPGPPITCRHGMPPSRVYPGPPIAIGQSTLTLPRHLSTRSPRSPSYLISLAHPLVEDFQHGRGPQWGPMGGEVGCTGQPECRGTEGVPGCTAGGEAAWLSRSWPACSCCHPGAG